jgi:hypothetical protein
MDFNNIFNRAPSSTESLGAVRGEYTVLEDWSTYLDEFLTQGRTEIVFDRARKMNARLRERLRHSDAASRYEEGIYKQSNLLDKHQTQELLNELEAFVRSRGSPVPTTDAETKALTDFLDDNVKETYDVALSMLFQQVFEAEDRLRRIVGPRNSPHNVSLFEKASEDIAHAYHAFNNDYPRVSGRYEALKADVKSKVPPRFHKLIDKTVELFVYDPYKLGILYIRRHLPGAIGVLQGLNEEETE